MPYSIGPIQAARGAYIHGWNDLSTSSGCIRISMTDAPILYAWASGRIRILVSA
jgi:lipoprotein-anchoring transpeptidase ErfK/SrfK